MKFKLILFLLLNLASSQISSAQLSENEKLLKEFRNFSMEFQLKLAQFFGKDSEVKEKEINLLFLMLLSYWIKAHDLNNQDLLKEIEDFIQSVDSDLFNMQSIDDDCAKVYKSVNEDLKDFKPLRYLDTLLTNEHLTNKLPKKDRALLLQPDPSKNNPSNVKN